MILQDIWDFCEKEIFKVPSTDILFNQYKDFDEMVDLPNAAEIRRNNLYSYFQSFQRKPKYFVVAEAPGSWGCRFSGIPLTSERQLISGLLPVSGTISSRRDPKIAIKNSTPYRSQTSDNFWKIMRPYYETMFIWNCIPFHPRESGTVLDKRKNNPTNAEVRTYAHILREIYKILNPKITISIGRKSEYAFKYLNIPYQYVRHPSYGGTKEFKEGILRILPGNNLSQYKGTIYVKETKKTIRSQDSRHTGYNGFDSAINIAMRKSKIFLIDQSRVSYIAQSWTEATNRAALIAILMASKHAGINIKDDYFDHVTKLTGKSCKHMPNFLGKLRKTPLVDKDLNWHGETFSGSEQLAKLLF